MKKKKITFSSEYPQVDIPRPIPADRAMPEWYKIMPRVADDRSPTVKTCMPFVDALMTGYVITLPVDMHRDKDGIVTAESEISIVSRHFDSQIGTMELDPSYSTEPMKYSNNWYIKTPKGYSCYITHPVNRNDLPFMTLTGVVDTDRHPVVINFPFVFKKDFVGTIPAGTPIAQIFPFKREDWSSEVIDDREPKRYPRVYELFSPPFNWYKRNWWVRKIYK